MDPTDWQYIRHRQWESLDPKRRSDCREKIEPEELCKIDEELARKRRKLQQIEKRILYKESTDAMKTTGPSLKAWQMFKDWEEELSHSKVDRLMKITPCIPFISTGESCKPFISPGESYKSYIPFIGRPTGEIDEGFSCSKSAYNSGPLKERVNVIMQQRWPSGFLVKALSTPSDHHSSPNHVEKTLNKDVHPLKLRVRALMNRRCNSNVLDVKVPDPVCKPHSLSQSPNTTIVENNLVLKGFQRFLCVLNEGVNIERLTKIVNDNEEHSPTGQEKTSVVKEKSNVCKSDSQGLKCRASQMERRSSSEERKTELHDQERKIQPEEKSAQNDDRDSRKSDTSLGSQSPPLVTKKPKLEQHHGQLQNILKTIGLSLDADDLSKLAERTQVRLYGRKHETKQRFNTTGNSKRTEQHIQTNHSHPSSLTSVSDTQSSCPSLTNTDDGPEISMHHSDAASATPTYHSDAGSATPTYHSDAKSAIPRYHSDTLEHITYNSNCATAIPTYISHDGASAIPTYSVDAESAIPRYISGVASAIPTYTGTSDVRAKLPTYNTDATSAVPMYNSSSFPPVFCNYSTTPLCPSPDTGALFGQDYPHPSGCNTTLGHSHVNTDLSWIKGQIGQRSGRYLRVINTESTCTTGILHNGQTAGLVQDKNKIILRLNQRPNHGTGSFAAQPKGLDKSIAQPQLTAMCESKKLHNGQTAGLVQDKNKTIPRLNEKPNHGTGSFAAHPKSLDKSIAQSQLTIKQSNKLAKKKETRKRLQLQKSIAREDRGERRKLAKTDKMIRHYIRLANSNRDNYSDAKQQKTLKRLLKKQERIRSLREEKKQELIEKLSSQVPGWKVTE